MVKAKKVAARCYVAMIGFLLYAPLMILIVCSFNDSKTRTVWGGFTLHWYTDLFQNEEVLLAVRTTLVLTTSAALIATVIGTLACIAMSAMGIKMRTVMQSVANIPLLNSEMVTGIAIMLLFVHFMTLGFSSMLIAHVTIGLPYVILNVMPKLQQVDKNLYEAALDLGAHPVYAFVKVVLPEISSGIISGFFFAFTISMDDFVVTYFTKGAGINTISTMLYQQLRRGINPEMYALSTILLFTILILLAVINRLSATRSIEETEY
ncbi:MAG: ABC transporter permease [Clostridiales bacterium]|nr:ABC transporter permease [Clostridiales bacterium]